MTEYQVIMECANYDSNIFESAVQERIGDGWELVGGVSMCITEGNISMSQALKRDKDE